MAPSADEGLGWPETLGIYVLRNTFCQFTGFVTWLEPPFGAFYPQNKVQVATRAGTVLSSCKFAPGMAPSADEGLGWPETLGIYVWRNTFCQFAGFLTW